MMQGFVLKHHIKLFCGFATQSDKTKRCGFCCQKNKIYNNYMTSSFQI